MKIIHFARIYRTTESYRSWAGCSVVYDGKFGSTYLVTEEGVPVFLNGERAEEVMRDCLFTAFYIRRKQVLSHRINYANSEFPGGHDGTVNHYL